MIHKVIVGLVLLAAACSAGAFSKGEEIVLPKGLWVCYDPSYIEESVRVFNRTKSHRKATLVFENTPNCTKLPVDAPYTIKERVTTLPVTVKGEELYFAVLKVNFNGGVDIYVAALDLEVVGA